MRPETSLLRPPSPLLERCNLPEPSLTITTNGELLDGFVAWRSAAKECAAQHAALVEWHELAERP